MEQSFLTINNHPVSLSDALIYLSNAGQVQEFTKVIVKEHLIEQELKTIEDADNDTIDQFIIDFRLDKNLIEPGLFQDWLSNNNLSFAGFKKQINIRLKTQKLAQKIIASKPSYFAENLQRFDTFILSRIVVDKLNLAQNLKRQIENNDEDLYFNLMAKKYSIVDDKIIGGFMSPMIRQEIPDLIINDLVNTPEGGIIGPVEIEQRFCLIKVEKILPAVLGGEIKKQLENEIVERWIQEQLKTSEVRLDFLDIINGLL